MSANWYVEQNGSTRGPLSSATLKQLAAAGEIKMDTKVRMGEEGRWTLAGKVKGLFPEVSTQSNWQKVGGGGTSTESWFPQDQKLQVKACDFCGEEIALTAIKCRHCNEFLDGRPRQVASQSSHSQIQQFVPQPAINVTQVTNVGHTAVYPRWNPLVAALLSFLIPGLGQLYKGQPINGLVWFFIVIAGYVAFIFPGLILHLCCILGAAMGNPYR